MQFAILSSTDYLDTQNMRATYIDNFLAKLVNWDFVNSNLPANA